ncbi:MAG: stimulus-sensing domain-containing protein [Alphaproteobacteria bacterium]|nr:stimulus-sensing domain-containing protein [Alphaproteobacteria bacterium]
MLPRSGTPALPPVRPDGEDSEERATATRFGITARILAVNVAGLVFLMFGVLYLNQFRVKLIDERSDALAGYSEIIAGILAETAVTTLPVPGIDRTVIDVAEANAILRRTILPSGYRARIYDRNGGLIADSWWLSSDGRLETRPLSAPGERPGFLARLRAFIDGLLPRRSFPPYREAGPLELGTVYEEVANAIEGEEGDAELRARRVNSEGELVLSVAVPIQRFKALLGVLLVSTEGSDIDQLVAEEEQSIILLFVIALTMTVLLTLGITLAVARPIKELAVAAHRVRANQGLLRSGFDDSLPHLAERWDEVGALARSLDGMTRALAQRIDAIERFAADVAHEIKNPLTSMRSALETLEGTTDPAARARLVEIVQADIKRLNRLISDIADASRLDAELGRAEAEPVSVPRLVENLALIWRDTHGGDGPQVVCEMDVGTADPGALRTPGVEIRLAQVFQNLLANAVSFSPQTGTVRLHVSLRGERPHRMVRVSVEDDGPGIPQDSLERIFERFYTQRPKVSDFGRNSGLGLSISRQIVLAHGGRIWAENRQGADGGVAGARLVVDLPVQEPEGP